MSSAELKAQGNARFKAEEFSEAVKKYTAAIEAASLEKDSSKELAVLYSNRAACWLSMKWFALGYLHAVNDAKKATQLDPTYAKAFARLAAAQEELGHPESKENWRRALNALPETNLTQAEQAQKLKYQADLASTGSGTLRFVNLPESKVRVAQGRGRTPWERAANMLPRLRVERPVKSEHLFGSVRVIHAAYEFLINGIGKMKQLRRDPTEGHWRGIPFAIADLTNGVMLDARVMHLQASDFVSLFDKQVEMEVRELGAWVDTGPEIVVQEALSRQLDQGWEAARLAISLTIRVWIMRAVIEGALQQRHDVAIDIMKCAFEVLRSLRETWSHASTIDRGVVFEPTFLFGLQRLYIQSLMNSYILNPSPERLEQLNTESELLLREVDEALQQSPASRSEDPGLISSYYIYPRGLAYSMKGFYCNAKAKSSLNDARELYRKAAVAYMRAADDFPEDDEQHPWFLNLALDNMFQSLASPLSEILDVMERIRLTTPKAKEIWEHSQLSTTGLWGILDGVSRKEAELRGMLSQGKVTLNSHLPAAEA
ncbi:hypothetical protein B0H15DRAFT_952799 [Mycena belliarum]|uniref:TPR-like protein n=1 Tax=Mycena belliarum TaxID=1033014 RepID=A0AAD6XMM1_9AGAR|nr:hypothetical protein B0H15DRAFT_952799 [Mycena belliae]